MGLLDDAIREHLELKRRRGADPGEVARQEREALEPVFDPSGEEEPAEPQLEGGPAGDHEDPYPGQDAPADGGLQGTPVQAVDLAPGQETAEIDMRSVLEAADEPAGGPPPAGPAPVRASHVGNPADGPGFEWDGGVSGDAEQPPAEIPGQERLTFE